MATITGHATAGMQSNVCPITEGLQEAGEAQKATDGLVEALERYGSGVGAGPSADASSPASAALEVNDLCKLGFLDMSGSGRYGQLPITMKCADLVGGANLTGGQTSDASFIRFIDADTKLGSVIDKLQYPLPAPNHWRQTKDGHVSFIGKDGVSVALPKETYPGVGSELDFAAAWKFCEHLQPATPTPTHSTSAKATIADIGSIKSDRMSISLKTSAASECYRSLAYRTSCPAASAGNMTNLATGATHTNQGGCVQAQAQVCSRLSAPRDQGGLGLSFINDDPGYANIIKHCDTEGISKAMYDAIMAKKCHDNDYIQKVLPSITGGDAAAVEDVVNYACPAAEHAFEVRLIKERERLTKGIRSLLQSQNSPSTGGDTSRSEK
jgi:hypothetical protein